MSFKQFVAKQERSRATLSVSERSYLDKIVDVAKQVYQQNKLTAPEALAEYAFKEALKSEMEVLERDMRNSLIYAVDIIKEKCPQLIQTEQNK